MKACIFWLMLLALWCALAAAYIVMANWGAFVK